MMVQIIEKVLNVKMLKCTVRQLAVYYASLLRYFLHGSIQPLETSWMQEWQIEEQFYNNSSS